MAGKGTRVSAALMCLAALPVFAEAERSGGDCSFQVDPDRFLEREGRARREVFDRIRKLQRGTRWSTGATAAIPPETIPQRNVVDQEIFGKLTQKGVPPARLSSDSEFIRRIYLDLTGRLPSSEDVRGFLADSSPNKRDAIIDKLLYSAEFADKWTVWLGDLLQNTAQSPSIQRQRQIQGRNAFFFYIRDAIYNQKSFDQIAREVITGSGNNYDLETATANFPMAGTTAGGPIQDTYDNMFVRSAATFLGLAYYDCLLCHNGRGHLDQISLWGSRATRAEAQSTAAFFARTRFTPYRDNPNAPQPYLVNSTIVSDAPNGFYVLTTMFGNRPNRTPIGNVVNLTPSYRHTLETPSNANWRAAFAELLVNDPMFAKNLVNRLWKAMFNLGLVDPVDTLDPARLDPANPPPAPWTLQATHPELLEKLAQEFINGGYQLRPFLKILAESSAYQLSSEYEGEWTPELIPLFARHYPRRLEGEEVHDAIAQATGVPGAYTVQFWEERIEWAMKLPEPVEPRSNRQVNEFMNTFLRGNRDNLSRSQAGSIQQQLALMNDPFVLNRLRISASGRLREIGGMADPNAIVDEIFLTFLSRFPSESERASALGFLSRANGAAARNNAVEDLAWAAINKVDFLFSY